MASIQTVFWISGAIILLEALYLFVSGFRRKDALTLALFFLSSAALVIGFANCLSLEEPQFALGLNLIAVGAPLGPFLWLLFCAFWGRDAQNDKLLVRTRGWFVLALLVALGLAGLSLKYPLLAYHPGPLHESQFFMAGYSFPVFVFFLTAYLFGLFNIENCYRSALGSLKQRLRIGFYASLILTGTAFASATLGILAGRLPVWALLGVFVALPVLYLILAVHVVRVDPSRDGVVVTRQIASSSTIILTGAVYFLVIGLLSRAIASFAFTADFLITVVAGLLAMSLLLTVVVTGKIGSLPWTKSSVAAGGSAIEGVRELIEEIALDRSVEDLLERLRLYLRSNFGVTTGAFVERFENSRYYIRYFDRSTRQSTQPELADTFEWLHRYGKPIRYSDLAERMAETGDRTGLEDELPFDPVLVIPVIGRQAIVGILVLGGESSISEQLEPLTRFFEMAASPFALAAQNCRITEQLITAREMESFHKISSYVLHDLKNSVGMLDMLLVNARKNIDNPQFQESMQRTIADAVTRQRRIIARLSEPEKAMSVAMGEVNVVELLKQVVDKVQVRKVERIEYEERLTEVPIVKGNTQQLKSVFENLIVNAIEAMPVSGRLSLSAGVEGEESSPGKNRVVVSIRDTGKGMSREFMENKLFRPFTSTKKKGLGIGMYQTYEAVRQMGGDIEVESEEGRGSTFRVKLPV